MNLVFDYRRLRKLIAESARYKRIELLAFLMDYEISLRRLAPSGDCVCIIGLRLGEPSEKPDVARHILGCNFCTRLVKIWLLLYLTDAERAALCDAIYAEIKERPDPQAFFRLFTKNALPTGCLDLPDLLRLQRLPKAKRKHAKTCPSCSAAIDFLRRVPLPKFP